jgi:integrase
MARDVGGRVIRGENVKKEKPIPKLTYGEFLQKFYEPWVVSQRKRGVDTMKTINATFDFLLPQPIEDLSSIEVEQWRTKRISEGRKAATINRQLAALQASINWGVKHELFKENPLTRLGRLREHDSDTKVRYLSEDERTRLMNALDAREAEIRVARKRHNEWAAERKYEQMPELNGEYADYLKPMVLLSLYTGIRQGNLFSLLWGDIDFNTRNMTLRASVSKANKAQDLPINSVAVKVLSAWREQSPNVAGNVLVFPSPRGGDKFDNCKKAWAALMKDAQIENFRWHDMRHDYASQLVMRGVDLNTVRALMGHASLAMTLRYAHLAPKNKLRASEILAEEFFKSQE